MVGVIYLNFKRHWKTWLKLLFLRQKDTRSIKSLYSKNKHNNVVISFTTIYSRIKSVESTIRSILNGSELAEGIYIYVNEKTYESLLSGSAYIKKVIATGYLHLKVVEDVGPYTKYIYAYQEFPDKDIVICDDDVIYPAYWLAELIKAHSKYVKTFGKKLIVCHRAHEALFNADGTMQSYSLWPKAITSMPASKFGKIFPTGTGGVLYPSGTMPKLAVDVEIFKQYAPTADDVWFWFCALSNNNQFVITDYKFDAKKFPEVPNSQTVNLFSVNVNRNSNDLQINKCLELFKEKISF